MIVLAIYACANLGGSGGMLPQENFDALRPLLVHFQA